MGRGKKGLLRETHIKVSIRMEDLMDLGLINGRMDQIFTMDPSKMVSDMGKVNGLQTKLNILATMHKV